MDLRIKTLLSSWQNILKDRQIAADVEEKLSINQSINTAVFTGNNTFLTENITQDR